MVSCSTAKYPVVEQVYAPTSNTKREWPLKGPDIRWRLAWSNKICIQRLLTNRSLEVGETPWLLRTAIRQQTTGQRQELRDLPQASSSRNTRPPKTLLIKELVMYNLTISSSVYSWRPEFAWSATTKKKKKSIDRKGCGGVPKSHNASHGL